MYSRPAYELADILNKHQEDLKIITTNTWKLRTLHAIRKCRTMALGGHIDRCDHKECGTLHLSYNSCRNRHCPKCQGHLREKWVTAREQDLLNVPYFHVVFTLPDHLNELSLQYPGKVYSLLFKTAWQVIQGFAAEQKFMGAATGMIAVLHTWGQNLSLHPHLHCILPAGGLTGSGKWRPAKNKGKFLFPVKAMGKVFRAKFIAALRKELSLSQHLGKMLFAKNWVVYCKRPFLGPQQVIEYLGRYTHKIAISNHRLKSLDKEQVSFSVKNYRKGGKKELCTVPEKEFIRRFALHILPKGFVRIRHYGLLSSTSKQDKLPVAREQTGEIELPAGRQKESCFKTCPVCKKGKLITLEVFDERGPPKEWLRKIKGKKNKRQRT